MADDIERRLQALRGRSSSLTDATPASSKPEDGDDLAKRLEALDPPAAPVDEDDEVERYIRQMSPPPTTTAGLDLPSVPSSSKAATDRLDANLDVADAASRVFTGPLAEVTFFPAPRADERSRSVEEEEELIRRLQDQLLVEGKEKDREDVLLDRLRRLRGDGGSHPGPPPAHDPGEFDVAKEDDDE